MVALRLPASRTKNRRPHRVALGALAEGELAALTSAAEMAGLRTSLVFPGIASRTAGICRRLRQTAGVADWNWHDCRRTAVTGMARLGARGGLIGIYQAPRVRH